MTHDGIPTICVSNAVDTLRVLAGRAPSPTDQQSILAESFPQQDQAVFWQPTGKLILTERPIKELSWQCDFLGIAATNLSPRGSSGSIFTNVLSDGEVLRRILNHIGPAGRFRLVPHTTTAELWTFVRSMVERFHVEIDLPESCQSQALRDHLDTKSGLRELVIDCGLEHTDARITPGHTCAEPGEAAALAGEMIASGQPCVIKPDRGEASVGLLVVRPGDPADGILASLMRSGYFADGEPLIVEEYIEGTGVVFPSVEFVVPADPTQSPYLTHVCDMLFDEPTQLRGNVTGQSLEANPGTRTSLPVGR